MIVFLEKLKRVIPGNILIVRDGLASHRSALVREYLAEQNGRFAVLRLPAYAPELNPVEYIWAHLKQHELPNVCSRDYWSLGGTGPQEAQTHGQTKADSDRLLEAVFFSLLNPLYYAGLSRWGEFTKSAAYTPR